MVEQWKPVVGYDDCYSISDLGRMARTSTYGRDPRPCWKIRAPALKNGYRSFHMCKDGVRKYRLAHIMVWEAFKGPIPPGMDVNHKNGDRDNPSEENLDLMTRSENCAHSFRVLGRKNFNVTRHGSACSLAKLAESDIPKIFAMASIGLKQGQIAAAFGVSGVSIGNVLRRKTWRHIESGTANSR